MTLGELARMLNRRDVPTDPDNPSGEPARLAVVPCRGWRRDMTWAEADTVDAPVAEHPETRHRARLPHHVSVRSHELVRGTRHREPVRTRRRDVGGRRVRGSRAIEEPARNASNDARRRAAGSNRAHARRCAPRAGPAAKYREAYFTPTSGPHAGRIVAGVQVVPVAADRALFARAYRSRRRQANVPERVRVARGRARAGRETPRGSKRGANHARDEPRGGVQIAHQSEAEGGERAEARAARARATRRAEEHAGSGVGSSVQSRWTKARRAMVAARAFDAAPPTIRRAPFVDLLTGTPRLREALDAPPEETAAAVEEVFEEWEAQLRTFVRVREAYLLY